MKKSIIHHSSFIRHLSFRLSECAANEIPNLGELAIGANERPLDDGEWQLVTPWGEFPHKLGRQVVGPAQGHAMVTAFNSVSAKLGRLFRGLPIFVGHPDVQPDKYPDKRRYGKIDALEVRDDGLYCKPVWNAAGEENRKEGYYVYPSPVWGFRKPRPGVIEPAVLVSIGLTNQPNISASAPWSENEKPAPVLPTRLPQLAAYRQSLNPYAALYGTTPKGK